jgi:hydroxylamine reductase
MGVCGKTADVAQLQDLLIYSLKGIALLEEEARKQGAATPNTDLFMLKALFSTLTNVNFDPQRFEKLLRESAEHRDSLRAKVRAVRGETELKSGLADFTLASTLEEMIRQGANVGLKSDVSSDPDVQSLHQIIIFGLKGIAAYAYHAWILGKKDKEILDFIYKALAATINPDFTVNELVNLVVECGRINMRTMELLDAANTETYGHPVPTKVPLGAKKGKAILVSGHDLKDLEEILKQTEGKGINVYTHGEMLPTHGYPKLKKYPHFYGHYGTAWQNQRKEFAEFPGAILMTTNCIQKPTESYAANIFTSGVVGMPFIQHISNFDFSPVIKRALELSGFLEDAPGKSVMVGFGHNTVLSISDKIVEAVKNRSIRHFFLVAGCDGSKVGRNYYTEFVEKIPKDCVVLTLACGKFRFFDKELGDIDGIPRLIDVGQCNDAYSAIQIASTLSKAFNLSVNDLPLSMVLSWFEQKAVAILLTLFYLGIKDIRLGPSLPAFITPNILNVLVEKFNVIPITTPDQDLKAILG